ncbi:autophagy-related 13b-like [Olea europaea subsp. europaea]|uniref:Autophagy-related 13b-like n=1 Tax=Olea europaea subsp. europaea TaxID=158383 RepID=A0A8S0PWI9_OLEEU|nr:autophagy-related 13b-like [Olea europaea subsp. europaea]
MASYQEASHSEPAKMEQIITEFFAKGLHIILESRCPYVSSRNYSCEQVLSSPSPSSSSSSSSSFWPRDKWFNLSLRDCPAALENIDLWRQSNLEPMIIDVILVQRPVNNDQIISSSKSGHARNFSGKERVYYSSDNEEFGSDTKREKIIERWVLQYESKRSGVSSGSKRSTCYSHILFNKLILLMRSLYATVRLLPAYKLFRDLNSSAQIRRYNLGHRVSSFVEPFTRIEEADMQRFVFTPVDTSCGRLCLSVLYHSSVLDVSSEPSTPISPQVIQEYVGSPLAEPLRKFSSRPMSQMSPASAPFGRRHSWGYDLYRASSPLLNPSPSPTYSESYASVSKQRSRLPPASLPRQLSENTPAIHVKNPSFDEYWPSPTFTPSPSASPPIYIPGSHVSNVLLRSESAPVSIPISSRAGISSLPNNQMLPPSPPMKATRSSVVKTDARSGLYKTSSTADKLLSFEKDEVGRMSRVESSSNISPPKSFSRSSSRFSYQDDYDDSEFSGPFVVDDDDMTDLGTRPGSFDQPGHPSGSREKGSLFPVRKSQHAAVGTLVQMLKKAPSLHQDISVTSNLLQGSKHEMPKNSNQDPDEISSTPREQQSTSVNFASSGLVSPKTTAGALEELCEYKEMKNSMLKQGKSPQA